MTPKETTTKVTIYTSGQIPIIYELREETFVIERHEHKVDDLEEMA